MNKKGAFAAVSAVSGFLFVCVGCRPPASVSPPPVVNPPPAANTVQPAYLANSKTTGPSLRDIAEKLDKNQILSAGEKKRLQEAANHPNLFQRAKALTLLPQQSDARGKAVAVQIAKSKISDKESLVRLFAFKALCRTNTLEAIKAAEKLKNDPDVRVRDAAAQVLTGGKHTTP